MPRQEIGDFGSSYPTPEFLVAENIRGGNISGEVIELFGTGGVIRTQDFETGVTGWAIYADGSAEFNNVTVRGAIEAGVGSTVDWSYIANVTIDNADITNLSFDKIIAGTNTATLTLGSGGLLRTAASGERLELDSTANQQLRFYNTSGVLRGSFGIDSGDANRLQITSGGSIVVNPTTSLFLQPSDDLYETFDTAFVRYRVGGQWDIREDGAGISQLNVNASRVLIAGLTVTGSLDATGATFSSGTSGSPSISGSDSDSGIYFSGASTLISYNGTQRFTTTSTGISVNGTTDSGPVTASGLVTGNQFRSSISGGVTSVAFGFSADIDTGMFRGGTNDGRLAAGGASIAQFTTGRFGPGSDNAITLGGSGLRWQEIWMVGGIGSVNNVSRDASGRLTVASSSRRFKNTIAGSDLGLSFIEGLRPVTFNWNEDEKISTPFPHRGDIGLIAEEVAQAPGADLFVLLDEEDLPLSVRYELLTVPLINAVKELSARVRELELSAK